MQTEAADLHPRQFSSAHYFSGPLYYRNTPFTPRTKLKPQFPALTDCCSFARVKKSNLVTGWGHVYEGLQDHLLTVAYHLAAYFIYMLKLHPHTSLANNEEILSLPSFPSALFMMFPH